MQRPKRLSWDKLAFHWVYSDIVELLKLEWSSFCTNKIEKKVFDLFISQ